MSHYKQGGKNSSVALYHYHSYLPACRWSMFAKQDTAEWNPAPCSTLDPPSRCAVSWHWASLGITGHHWALRLTESTVPGPRHSTSRPTASQSAARAQALDHLRSQILNKITYIRLTLDYIHIIHFLFFTSCIWLFPQDQDDQECFALCIFGDFSQSFEPLDPNG